MTAGIYNHKPHSQETKDKIGLAHKGKHYHTKESKRKIGESCRGEKSYKWKGENTAKITKHIFVVKYKPKPRLCEICKQERKLNLANIKNHNYTKNLNDYRWLCYSCHKRMDIGDYCKNGHRFEGIDNRGRRYCKECRKERISRYR